jgi:hypothetical protein
VGVLQRFERRLEGLVEGAFARAFGGVVQPVEVAAALQREAADKKAIVGQGRVLVPNAYVVELGSSDAERLREYDAELRKELADMVLEHAQEQGWSFVGPVTIAFEDIDDLATGVFRVRSSVVADATGAHRSPVVPAQAAFGGAPRLEMGGRPIPLTPPVFVLGRGADADLRLPDTGVSRRHAELHLQDGAVTLVDLSSTNGTTVNGQRLDRAQLSDGDRIGIGTTVLVYRQGA